MLPCCLTMPLNLVHLPRNHVGKPCNVTMSLNHVNIPRNFIGKSCLGTFLLKHADELCLNDQWYVKTEAIARPILKINRARIRKSNRMTCYKTLLRKCCYMSYMWFKEQLIGFSFASVSFESRNQTISSIYSHVLAKLIYCKPTPSTYEHF